MAFLLACWAFVLVDFGRTLGGGDRVRSGSARCERGWGGESEFDLYWVLGRRRRLVGVVGRGRGSDRSSGCLGLYHIC